MVSMGMSFTACEGDTWIGPTRNSGVPLGLGVLGSTRAVGVSRVCAGGCMGGCAEEVLPADARVILNGVGLLSACGVCEEETA